MNKPMENEWRSWGGVSRRDYYALTVIAWRLVALWMKLRYSVPCAWAHGIPAAVKMWHGVRPPLPSTRREADGLIEEAMKEWERRYSRR